MAFSGPGQSASCKAQQNLLTLARQGHHVPPMQSVWYAACHVHHVRCGMRRRAAVQGVDCGVMLREAGGTACEGGAASHARSTFALLTFTRYGQGMSRTCISDRSAVQAV